MAPIGSGPALREPAEQVISRALEPGEEIVWAGRPDADVLLAGLPEHQKRALIGTVVTIGLVAAAGWWLFRQLEAMAGSDPEQWSEVSGMVRVPLFATAGILLFAIVLRYLGRAGFIRWAHSLTYAITDRRLLILEKGRIKHQFRPDHLLQPELVPRSAGYYDVEFARRRGRGEPIRRASYQQWQWEKSQIAFKALIDAAEVKRRIETWKRDYLEGVSAEVEDFVEDRRPIARSDAPSGSRRVVNPKLGFTIDVPEEWTLKARWRRKPYGTTFLDNENWFDPVTTDEWNVLRAEGPAHTSIEVHVDEVEQPVVTYANTVQSTLAKLFGGGPVAEERDISKGAFRGFSVTRKLAPQTTRSAEAFSPAESTETQPLAFWRVEAFHDGRRQLAVLTTWPEGSDTLEKAVAKAASTVVLK